MNLVRLLLCSAAIGVMAAPSQAATRNQKRFDNLTCFLNAASTAARGKLMADDYHFYFNERTGDGDSKEKFLQSFDNWDGPLHPDITILDHKVDGDVWTITIVELNDFAKLIGFPGWRATETITFDNANRIREVIYVPIEAGKDYREYLNPALDWLKANKPDDLKDVYDLDKKRLIRTNASATKWVVLLNEWRAATK